MRNIKLTLEYDGTDFHGWQIQPERRTVQGVLATGLGTLLQETVKILSAGRTDAGVHAQGQVANFSTLSTLSLQHIHRGLNALLPSDVVVKRVQEVPLYFHARYSATGRRYLYRIATRPTALDRRFVWCVLRPIDIPVMRRTSEALLGEHDFTAFCLGSKDKNHCRCHIHQVLLRRSKGEIHFEILANRFLHAMVRILVGWLVEVGRRRLSPEEFKELLQRGKPDHPVVVAPAQGLCLMDVLYGKQTESGKGDGR